MTALPRRTVEDAARAYWGLPIMHAGNRQARGSIEAALTAAMDPALGPDRLVVAVEHEREVRADQTRRIVERLRHNIKPAVFAASVADAIEREFGGGDDA